MNNYNCFSRRFLNTFNTEKKSVSPNIATVYRVISNKDTSDFISSLNVIAKLKEDVATMEPLLEIYKNKIGTNTEDNNMVKILKRHIKRCNKMIKQWPVVCDCAAEMNLEPEKFIEFARYFGYNITTTNITTSPCNCIDGGTWVIRGGNPVCQVCGAINNHWVDHTQTYKDLSQTKEKDHNIHDRSKQAREYLMSLQAVETTEIDDDIYQRLVNRLKLDSKEAYLKLTKSDVLDALKSEKLSSIYSKDTFIYCFLISKYISSRFAAGDNEKQLSELIEKSKPPTLTEYELQILDMYNTVVEIYFTWIRDYQLKQIKVLKAQTDLKFRDRLTPSQIKEKERIIECYNIAKNVNDRYPCTNQRSSFLNTSFVTKQILLQLGLDELVDNLSRMIKTTTTMHNHLIWYRAICDIAKICAKSEKEKELWQCKC
jgi:hypothetical protein